MTHAEQFRDAIRAAGLNPPDVIHDDGKLHRFAPNGKRRDDAAWYVLHGDGIPAGAFGDWRTGQSETWRANVGRTLTPAEEAAHRERVAAMRREREAEEVRRHAEVAKIAAATWQAAKPAPADHAYLRRKGIKPHGARLADDGRLIVPVRVAGEIASLQFIGDDGAKRFLPGGRVAGGYFGIGKPDGAEALCIAEGFATGATIHAATGQPVAVAFNAGNLAAAAQALRERFPALRLVLCADDDYRTADNPGLSKATEAARAVGGLLAVPHFGDARPDGATDFNDLAQHRGPEAVERAIAGARTPDGLSGQPGAPDAPAAPEWPAALDPAALHGIAGEFVRAVEPNTEADPAAILLQFLVAFGALVGRGPHFRVEGDQHHANLFALLVGATAKGRKGTSWGRVREALELVAEWKPHVSGLSSGEGLKWAVRDAREETKRSKNGEIVTEIVDEGVTDKRLLVIESEFASALRAVQRQGNTLSATVREAWDTGNLRTLTKNDPITATGAHICIVGHVTADELRAELTATDSANGFANRFLFVAVRRSKLLPFGGARADEAELRAFAGRLAELVGLARSRGRLAMSGEARRIWATVYPALSAGGDGLHGAVTARAEAQCIRLALVYALLDGAAEIDAPHLMAALAVWQYCDATARHVFGASLGDRIADEIMRRLRAAGDVGMTRTDIRDAFGRHQSVERIGAALELLRRKGSAQCATEQTGGRPVEVWRATKAT